MNDEQNLNWYIQKILDGGINIKGVNNFTDQISLSGEGLIKKLIWLNSGAVKAPGANGAIWNDLGMTGTWQFIDNNTRYVVASSRFPKSILTTEDITIKIKWSSPANGAVFCRWQLEYLVRAEDDNMSAAGVALGFEDDAPSAVANGLTITTFTIPYTAINCCDEILFLRLARIGGADTLGNVVNMSGMTFIYVCDKFFSSYVL